MTTEATHTNGSDAPDVPFLAPKPNGRIATLETEVAQLKTQMAGMQQLVAQMVAQNMLSNPAIHQKLAADLIAGMNGAPPRPHP